MHIQQLFTLVDMCVYVVYAYFECVNVVIQCACPLPGKGDDQNWLITIIPVPVDKKPERVFKIPVPVHKKPDWKSKIPVTVIEN